jgi:putative glutamine amidotransferase
MRRPLIAVSAAREELPTAFGTVDCTKLTTAYTDAVYAAGGRPLILPVVPNPPRGLLDGIDALLLTGGGDLDPDLYGESPDPSVYGIRRDRDDFEAALYHQAKALDLPVLAICRGMQLVNVLRGGTLLQQLTSERDHWQSNPASEPSHEIDVLPDAALAEALGAVRAGVNSYHHQCLRDLGSDLRVTAMCDDVIEAVEATDMDLVAVQWHPEQMASSSREQRGLFETLVRRASNASLNDTQKEMARCPTS